MLLLIYYLILLPIVAAIPTPIEYCYSACQETYRGVTFSDSTLKPDQAWEIGACEWGLQASSLYLCMKIYCTSEEITQGIKAFERDICLTYGNLSPPPFELVDGYTDDEVARLSRMTLGERYGPIVREEIVVPDKHLYELGFHTLDAAYFELRTHWRYSYALYHFWILVLALGLSQRLLALISSFRIENRQWKQVPESDETSSLAGKQSIISFPYILLKRFITVPATFGNKHAQAVGWCTIPTRVQTITIAAFVLLNIIVCSASYDVFRDNLYWPTISAQVWRYVADRTGIVSTANLALIWTFGVRNNTLLWLTGWDFATYNNFHRWVARVATVEAVVHSVAYTVLIFDDGTFSIGWRSYVAYYQNGWFVAGVLATVFMAAVCAFSVYGLRRSFYEVFLVLHIVLSILVLITMWYHLKIAPGEYDWFIWPCVIVWVFDRLLRFIRLFLFNPRFWNTKGIVTYDSKANIVRVAIPYSTSFVKPHPGTFYFITSLNEWNVWESHPFTLSYATLKSERRVSHSPSLSLGTISPPSVPNPVQQNTIPISSESETLLECSSTTPPSSLIFIIRPYDGFTSRLRDSALLHPRKTRVLVEGPYGETQAFHQYQNVLFIVGGTGIAVPLSYLISLLGPASHTTALNIIWAVRESAFLNSVLNNDIRGALDESVVSLTAYITQGRGVDKNDSAPEGLELRYGRPDVFSLVQDAIREAGNSSIAVVACGPGKMADEARRATVEMLGRGFGRVEYFEESFNW